MARTCRCFICGAKNAGSNKARRSYVRAGITRDEDGIHEGAMSKKQTRKLRRLREKRQWRKEET